MLLVKKWITYSPENWIKRLTMNKNNKKTVTAAEMGILTRSCNASSTVPTALVGRMQLEEQMWKKQSIKCWKCFIWYTRRAYKWYMDANNKRTDTAQEEERVDVGGLWQCNFEDVKGWQRKKQFKGEESGNYSGRCLHTYVRAASPIAYLATPMHCLLYTSRCV